MTNVSTARGAPPEGGRAPAGQGWLPASDTRQLQTADRQLQPRSR